MRSIRMTTRTHPVRAGALALAFAATALAAGRASAQPEAGTLRFTLKTIENQAGVRVILEFTRKPIYEVRGDARRVYVALKEGSVDPPFKKRDYGGAVLDKVKFVEGFRTAEVVLYTGDDYSSFSSFEMGEPFRLVIDLRKKEGPPLAVAIPQPGTVPGGPPPPGRSSVPPPGGGQPPGGAPAPERPGAPAGAEGGAAARPEFVVVLDPGHGGDDHGARGPSGLMEKDVTLDLARRLKERIQTGMEAEVILTRDGDRAVPLDERTAIANHHRADLFVSLHANASRRPNIRGSETYFLSYQATDDDARTVAAIENNALGLDEGVQGNSNLELILWDLAQSAFLKESSALAEIVQDSLNDAVGISSRGIKQAPFRVLMGATMPAILIEVAFISNPEEERRLRDPAFKDRLAGAILGSVERFREKYVRSR
jgi:N-acetylmuramoyl-L-alanine amidase